MEAAGGASCVCPSESGETIAPQSILDVPVNDMDRRVGVCYGSKDEVRRFQSYIFSSAAPADQQLSPSNVRIGDKVRTIE